MSDELNYRVADALLSMPKHSESAFCVIPAESIDPVLFARRFRTLPDGGPQVYALSPSRLELFRGFGIASAFTYTLNVSPMAPVQIHAVVLNTKGSDPLVQLHAPEFAYMARQHLVIHFTNQEAMLAFI